MTKVQLLEAFYGLCVALFVFFGLCALRTLIIRRHEEAHPRCTACGRQMTFESGMGTDCYVCWPCTHQQVRNRWL